jgi:hypothetical protein
MHRDRLRNNHRHRSTGAAVNHIRAEYTGGALILGVLWWLVYLRPRLNKGEVGIARPENVGS